MKKVYSFFVFWVYSLVGCRDEWKGSGISVVMVRYRVFIIMNWLIFWIVVGRKFMLNFKIV